MLDSPYTARMAKSYLERRDIDGKDCIVLVSSSKLTLKSTCIVYEASHEHGSLLYFMMS
jgi:hypothetical protein